MCMVVNDDEMDKQTLDAGQKTNGYFMRSYKDEQGEPRQAFYRSEADEQIPKDLKEICVGAKRTSLESREDYGVENRVIQVRHFRDYAYTKTTGGTKGELVDYILYSTSDDRELRYAPVASKLKLNKKRKAYLNDEGV